MPANTIAPTPLIALFGLPNSGKSTLLNRLSSTKKAIVAREAHTTRDLNYAEVLWDGYAMQMVDTGGLVPNPEDKIQKEIQIKSWSALQQADILIWVIDRKQNVDTITDLILKRVWKLGKKVIIAVNKVDNPNMDRTIDDYAKLGAVEFINVSAVNGYGLNDLLDKLVATCIDSGFPMPEQSLVIHDTKKKKLNRRKSSEVVKDKEGGYKVVRQKTEAGRQGLFESYQTGGAIYNIDSVVVSLEEVMFDQDLMPIMENFKILEHLKSQEKKIYFCTNLTTEQITNGLQLSKLSNVFSGGVIGNSEVTTRELLKQLYEEYLIELTSSIIIHSNEEILDIAASLGMWTIRHIEYYPLDYVSDRIEAMEFGFIAKIPSTPKIILLGKPNVGKSSLFNALTQKDLQIVTETAGTTLSVNDTLLSRSIPTTNKVTGVKSVREKEYVLLDSTGIRKPGQRTFGAESFATFRTIEAAYEADVICFMVDGSQDLSHQDQVVAGVAKESKNGLVVIINKADLLDEEQKQQYLHHFHHRFRFLKVNEFVWVSAKESTNLDAIWKAIDSSLYNRTRLISRAEVRKLFNYLMKQKPPKKLRTKKRPVIYDLLYTSAEPPTFELLIKDKKSIHWSYVRFLENIIRDQFGFKGTGIKLNIEQVNRRDVLGISADNEKTISKRGKEVKK
jgi:small GTP-binding protein